MRHVSLLLGLFSLTLLMGQASAESPNVDATVDSARQAARAERHDQAIATFRVAIAAAPERRREWLLELADELTWSGRLDEAIALYQEGAATNVPTDEVRARIGLARALSWDGQHSKAIAEYDRVLARDPAHRDAGLGRAQVLSWSERHADAVAQYQAVLSHHPGDADALRGRGRVESWRGRHRAAIDQMQSLLKDRPEDREATLILADSLNWMGRPDRAEDVLRAHSSLDPSHARASEVLDDLVARRRPETRVDFRTYNRSDKLDITEVALSARFHFDGAHSYFGPRYSSTIYSPANGPVEEIEVRRPGFEARYRFSDAFDWHGSAFVDMIETRGAPGDHSPVTYDTYVTFLPNDFVRFDVGASKWIFDSEEALVAGLSASQVSASMDVAVTDRTRLSARVSEADYSDGNERSWWQIQADRRVLNSPRVTLGYRYTGFDFERPGQRGYYNPDLQHTNELIVQAYGALGKNVYWDFRSALGYEVEDPGESRTIGAGGVSLTWSLNPRVDLEFGFDYSSSRTQSTTGFERSIGRVTLRSRF